jgi:hypothetical protein
VKRIRRGFIAALIIVSLVAVSFLGLSVANSGNDKFSRDLSKLEEDYKELQTRYYALLGNYSNLESRYKSILFESISPASPSGSSNDASTAQQYLARYAALQELYKELQSEYNQYQSDYRKLKELTDARLMQSSLYRFITPNDPAITNKTLEITGELNRSSTLGLDWPKIKALYDWVNNNIEYCDDGLYPQLPSNLEDVRTKGLSQTNQMAQYPNETLRIRTGDCEDTAVLLVSMIRAYISVQAECIWITGQNAGHVAVVVPIGEDQIVIMDPVRDYYSHNVLGEMAVNNISTEIYEWLNIWRPTLGNDVHIYRVFSDYMDKYFESTQEYIDWQYNR